MSHKLFILTGEPSGDLHGSNLVKALLEQQPDLTIKCWGGDRMRDAGAEVLKHIDELAFMGFVEVVANLRTILRNFKLCRSQIESFQPDAVVLIDYPGFNLRMAKHIKNLGIPVYYYIPPQAWAWKESRVHKVKRLVDLVFTVLPFEHEFYQKYDVRSEYVGHPLLDEIKQRSFDDDRFRTENGIASDKPIIALLPGSRTQEIKLLLKPIAQIISEFKSHQFVVSKVPWQPSSLYSELPDDAILLEGNTYDLLHASDAAIVTSGTATLETGLIGTPEIVVYRANAITVFIARMLVKVKFISLVNLILDRPLVKELIQQDVQASKLKAELSLIVSGGSRREEVLKGYEELREKLGRDGASKLVASRLLKILENG